MKIVWDEPKRLANIGKHGLDFADLDEDFFLASTIRAAKDGRLMAIGRIVDGVVAVVFARLGSEGISIISMRPANQAERRLFDGKT
ncbi:BrnT family toxin [Mesorhizobium sp. LjNodule214]|uniref:BrnT family toxin n=1 Tax=Mesorhizobium sp. LjNodule214 TaxID=3342252 RepID=UPI003ECD9801